VHECALNTHVPTHRVSKSPRFPGSTKLPDTQIPRVYRAPSRDPGAAQAGGRGQGRGHRDPELAGLAGKHGASSNEYEAEVGRHEASSNEYEAEVGKHGASSNEYEAEVGCGHR